MLSLFSDLRKRRLERDIRKAEVRGDVESVSDILRACPELLETLVAKASESPRLKLIYSIALADVGDERCLAHLQELLAIRRSSVPWDDLEEDEALDLARFVSSRDADLYTQMLEAYGDDHFEAVGVELEDKSERWLRLALLRDRFWLEASDIWMSRDPTGTNSLQLEATSEHLVTLQEACVELLDRIGYASNHVVDLLRQITLLAGNAEMPSTEWFIRSMLDHVDTLSPLSLVSLARLLRRRPDHQAVPQLRRAWLRLDEHVRRDDAHETEFGWGGKLGSDS